MSKDMSNIDIVQYEGGDYAKIMDNYNLHEITAAIANRAGKAAETIEEVKREVERLENNPDVVDIVATYADLQAYDTQGLTDKDVIRVLQDETHDGDSTYYRYDKQADTWTYIGESKQYTDFVGTDGTTAGTAGLVPAPATTDAGKFLKADGTWDTVQAGPTVVQTTGTSTTDVMSQNAVTSMIWRTNNNIAIGKNATLNNPLSTVSIGNTTSAGWQSTALGTSSTAANYSVSVGNVARAEQAGCVVMGTYAQATLARAVAIGGALGTLDNTKATASYAIALGAGAMATQQGQFDVSTGAQTTSGYNNSNYRLLTGLYDPQSDHDAATKGYVDTAVASVGASTISLQDWSDLWQ